MLSFALSLPCEDHRRQYGPSAPRVQRLSFWLGFWWWLLSHSGKITPLYRIIFPWCSLGSRWSLKILLAMWPHIIEWGCGMCWKEHRHWYREDLSVNPGSCLLSFVTLGTSPNLSDIHCPHLQRGQIVPPPRVAVRIPGVLPSVSNSWVLWLWTCWVFPQ